MPPADPYATTRCGRRSANGHAGIFTQIAHFGAAPGGYCANQIADHNESLFVSRCSVGPFRGV
jgi:hypothetical protein